MNNRTLKITSILDPFSDVHWTSEVVNKGRP